MIKLNLTKDEITQKLFLPNERGYDPDEVDALLDLVIKDYQIFEEELKLKDNTIHNLKEELEKKHHSKSITNIDNEVKDTKEIEKKLNNLELLRRVSILEKKLYSLGIDPTKIK